MLSVQFWLMILLFPKLSLQSSLGSIGQHLIWNDHIEDISLEIAKSAVIISRLAYLLPNIILLTLYHSLICMYLHLIYCNEYDLGL